MDQGLVALVVMIGLALVPAVPPVLAKRVGVGICFALAGFACLVTTGLYSPHWGVGAWLALFVASCLYAGMAKRGDRRHAELIAASRAR